MHGFVDDAARAAFGEAVRAIERESAAEAVVTVRRQSASWVHAHILVGCVGAVIAHAFMLYSDHPFALLSLLIDPIVAGVLVGLASTVVLGVKRWLTPRRALRKAVQTAARAAFYDKGIRRTRGQTGLLLYISIAEQMAEVVIDDAVDAATPAAEWARAVAEIDQAVARGGVATARAFAALAPALAAALPRSPDDVNELSDDLHVGEHVDGATAAPGPDVDGEAPP